MKRRETVQYQRSAIPDFDRALDKAKEKATKCYVDRGDMLGPSCVWLLVLPDKMFLCCNARFKQEGDVHPDAFLKLPIEWLKIDNTP